MPRPVKRTLSFNIPESAVKVSRTSSYSSKKRKNKKLLSGATNVDNKILSFAAKAQQLGPTQIMPFHKSWRANDPYDPDPALGGSSAYGFASMAARFDKYYVKSSKFSIVSSGYNNTKAQLLCMIWADNTYQGDYSDINTNIGICRANGGKMFEIPHVLASSSKPISISMNTKDLYRGGLGDEDNSALVTTNPVNEIYFHILVSVIGLQDFESGTGDINMCWNIEYDTMFYDPKDIV